MDNQPMNQPTHPAGGDVQPQDPPAAYPPYQPPAMPPRPCGIKTWQIVSITIAGAVVAIVVIIIGVIALSGSMNRVAKEAKDYYDSKAEPYTNPAERKTYTNDTISFGYPSSLQEMSLEGWNYTVRKGTVSDRRVFGDKDMNYFVVYTQIKDDGHPAGMSKLQMKSEMSSLFDQAQSSGSGLTDVLRHEQLICQKHESNDFSDLTASTGEIADGTPVVSFHYVCDSRVENEDSKIEAYQSTWYDHKGRLNTITVSANAKVKNKYGRDSINIPGLTARLR